MKISSLTVLALAITLSAAVAEAGPRAKRTPEVRHRQVNQEARIAQGVKSGSLTEAEAKQLQSEQKAIRTEKQAYRSDGVVTRAERKDLHQDQNQASKDIRADKHNAETAPKP